MASQTLELGEFKPDLPPAGQLTVCTNALPTSAGYGSVGSFVSFTPALAGITGGAAFVSSQGTTAFLAGTATDLYRYSGVSWASVLSGQTAKRWRFAQYGDNAIGVNGGPPVNFKLNQGTAALLAGQPPNSDMVAVVGDFAVVAGDPANIDTVTWSGLNNSEQWPATSTPDKNQSDSQQMLDGGEVMGLASGEYGVVLQRQAIKRMTYQGGDVIFAFGTISSNIGCMAKGSVAQAGRLVFFLSERGFYYTDGASEPVPIGFEKIDATFFATYSRQDIETGIYAAVDPRRNLVIWSMPGNPGKLWCYNYQVQRWSVVSVNVSLVFSGFSPNVSLDAIDARYGNLDATPVSLDDPVLAGGNPLFLLADQMGDVGLLSGAALDAVFTWTRANLTPGRARIRSATPATDAKSVIVSVKGRARASDLGYAVSSAAMRANGSIPLRINGQQFEFTMTVQAPWTYAQGMRVDFETGGAR